WWNEYFPKQPLVGRGFGFQSQWTKPAAYNPTATDFQQIVETGTLHNGLFAALDAVGITGTRFFVAWNVRLLILVLQVPFRRNDPGGFTLRFLALYLAVMIVSYWGGAATMGSFLPGVFALAGVFLRLRQEARSEERPRLAPPPRHRPVPKRQLVPA
nr:hypothetical protein [Chthoniobacterales bacterium]